MLFNKLKINKVFLKNRIVISPMCQYSAINGSPTLWHYNHLSKLACTGAAMLMIESTAVNKNGKISHKDLCLSNKKQEYNLKKLKNHLQKISDISLGIQISHAGRKGSSMVPWVKSNSPIKKKNSWQTYAPSSIKRSKNWPIPKSLTSKQIRKIIVDFKKTAIRAKRIGFDCLEIHMAHGYLLHQFLSPISNKRLDEYGSNRKNRTKLPLEIASEIRKIWPKNKILGARITATDHLDDGINLKDSIEFVKKLKKIGFDYVCVSSGGILPVTKLKFKNAFRKKFSKKIKSETKILTRITGQIDDVKTVNRLLKDGSADFIAVARRFIKDPNWILREAKKNKIKNYIPNQYLRCL